jgi:hypothetical protein
VTANAADTLSGFWNARYSAEGYAYGTEPNDFLVSVAGRFPVGARVLCLADGEGRNGVWLARQGFGVTSVDIAGQGMEKAAQLARQHGVVLETRVADLAVHELGASVWDAIVSIFVHLPPKVRRDLHARCVVALRPGAYMAFEAYGPGQLGRGTGGPPEAALLPTLAEIEAELAGCSILHRFSGLREVQEGRHHNGPGDVVQVLAQKES